MTSASRSTYYLCLAYQKPKGTPTMPPTQLRNKALWPPSYFNNPLFLERVAFERPRLDSHKKKTIDNSPKVRAPTITPRIASHVHMSDTLSNAHHFWSSGIYSSNFGVAWWFHIGISIFNLASLRAWCVWYPESSSLTFVVVVSKPNLGPPTQGSTFSELQLKNLPNLEGLLGYKGLFFQDLPRLRPKTRELPINSSRSRLG